MMIRLLPAAFAASVFLTAACGDIVHPEPRVDLNDQLWIFALLNPDSARHTVVIAPIEGLGPAVPSVGVTIHKRVSGSFGPSWIMVSRDSASADSARMYGRPSGNPASPCAIARSGATTAEVFCLAPEAALEAGATYRVEAWVPGRPSAIGTTRAVGGFEIVRAVLSDRGESPYLSAKWTESLATDHYLMGIRRWVTDCIGCSNAWFADLDSTSFAGPVPREAIDSAGPVPTLDVAAMDEHLHAFLTTGHGGLLFSVPPVQNVEGGFGVVGSARFRSLPIVRNQ